MHRDYLQQRKKISPLMPKMPSFDGNPASVAPSVQNSSSILILSCTVLWLIIRKLQLSVAPVARFFLIFIVIMHYLWALFFKIYSRSFFSNLFGKSVTYSYLCTQWYITLNYSAHCSGSRTCSSLRQSSSATICWSGICCGQRLLSSPRSVSYPAPFTVSMI